MNAPATSLAKSRDFSGVGYDEAIERARALIPFLRKHGPDNDKATKLVPEVVNALHDTGLWRYIQPKAWGGMELDFIAYFDIPEMLGRGDASTGWVVANLASHHRGLALWPRQAQEEIWGTDPDTLIASGIAFVQGTAHKVDGGSVLFGAKGFKFLQLLAPGGVSIDGFINDRFVVAASALRGLDGVGVLAKKIWVNHR